MRANPAFNTEEAIQDLGTGEAVISFLDRKGSPSVVQKCLVMLPESRLGPLTAEERNKLIKDSALYGKYEKAATRGSIAKQALQSVVKTPGKTSTEKPAIGSVIGKKVKEILLGATGPRGGKHDGLVQKAAKIVTKN